MAAPPDVVPEVAAAWALAEGVDHLNHGSFGAAPLAVLEAQQRWRGEMERNPVRFMEEAYQPALDVARSRLGAFVGASPDGLVFVRNATSGVNAVLRSIRFAAGDEIVITDHGYNAVANAVDAVADATGALVRVARVPFPLADAGAAIGPILAAVSGRTRLVIVDHVTSPTAVILPVAAIVAALEPDVPVLVDGAHAPGMLDVALDVLGASYAVGNCHKWMCAPKGAGFLHSREDRRPGLGHAVVSHGYNGKWEASGSRYHALFDWIGTDDPSPWLTVPAAIDVVATLHPEGWPGVRAANHSLAVAGRGLLLDAFGIDAPVPEDLMGSMASVPLPTADIAGEGLTAVLRHKHHIEVPVFAWPGPGHHLVRISAFRYNHIEQYERLAVALTAEVGLR